MLLVPLNRDRKKVRRQSMLGTGLFALAIAAAIISVITNSVWMAGAAVALLVPAVSILYHVGKSLS